MTRNESSSDRPDSNAADPFKTGAGEELTDERSQVADGRDRLADERERVADERDEIANERERLAVFDEPPKRDVHHLRVLIANERRDRLELLAQVVTGLGHEVIARETYVGEVRAATAREHPDVALVGLGLSSEHALKLISEIVHTASCPVIAILRADDPAYVREAARRGIFAYIIDGTPEELQSAIDITLQRFGEYQSLQGAFGRRALIEQAKGILMARDSIGAEAAFILLRDHSQHNGRKLSDVAAAVVESHLLLLPPAPTAENG
jgi:two-component system, response regulator / RNA-binding antiterminator